MKWNENEIKTNLITTETKQNKIKNKNFREPIVAIVYHKPLR